MIMDMTNQVVSSEQEYKDKVKKLVETYNKTFDTWVTEVKETLTEMFPYECKELFKYLCYSSYKTSEGESFGTSTGSTKKDVILYFHTELGYSTKGDIILKYDNETGKATVYIEGVSSITDTPVGTERLYYKVVDYTKILQNSKKLLEKLKDNVALIYEKIQYKIDKDTTSIESKLKEVDSLMETLETFSEEKSVSERQKKTITITITL